MMMTPPKQSTHTVRTTHKLQLPIEDIYKAIHATLNAAPNTKEFIPNEARLQYPHSAEMKMSNTGWRVILATLSRFKACRLFALAEKRPEANAVANMSDSVWEHIKDIYAKKRSTRNGERKALEAMEARKNGKRKGNGKASEDTPKRAVTVASDARDTPRNEKR